jgi:hypothetical protein
MNGASEQPERLTRRLVAEHPDRTLIIATFLAWILAAWIPSPVIGLVGTISLVFWLPGVALLRLLRPQPWSMSASTACLSTTLSAAVAIAVGIALAVTTNHVPRVPAATILCGLTIGAAVIAGRRTAVATREPDGRDDQRSSWPVGWIIGTVSSCCVLTGLLTYLTWRLYETPAPGGTYTALSVSYQGRQADIVVDNDGTTAMRFRLTVSQGKRTIVTHAFTLRAGAEYQLAVKASLLAGARGRSIARLVTEPNGRSYRSLVF